MESALGKPGSAPSACTTEPQIIKWIFVSVVLLAGVTVGAVMYGTPPKKDDKDPSATTTPARKPISTLLIPIGIGGFLALCAFFPSYTRTMLHPVTSAEGICNLVLNATAIALFVGWFFFTFATIVEQRVVQKQTDIIVENISQTAKALAPQSTAQFASTLAASGNLCLINPSKEECASNPNCIWNGTQCTMTSADMSASDKKSCEANRKLKKKAMGFLIPAFVGAVAFVIVVFLWGWWGKKRHWVLGKERQAGGGFFKCLFGGKWNLYPTTMCNWQQLTQIILIMLVTVAFVGATEFCFLRFVGSNYRTADPNLVKRNVIRAMRDYADLPAIGQPGAPKESDAKPDC